MKNASKCTKCIGKYNNIINGSHGQGKGERRWCVRIPREIKHHHGRQMNLLQLWWLSKMYIWVFPKIGGTPQIIHFNRVFQFKPSILGYPYFWKHPYFSSYLPLVTNLSGPIKGQTGSHVQQTCKNREPSEYHVCTLPISQLRFKTLENSFTVTPWESTKGLWLTNLPIRLPCLPPCVGFFLPCSRMSRHPC